MRNRPEWTRRRVGLRERSTVIRVLTDGEVTERDHSCLIGRDAAKLQSSNKGGLPNEPCTKEPTTVHPLLRRRSVKPAFHCRIGT